MKTSGRFLVRGAPLLAKGAARWLFGTNGPDEIKDLLQAATEEDVVNCLGNYAERSIRNHLATAESIDSFKKLLHESVDSLKIKKLGYRLPLFVFIDELDRCRPTYAIEFLEHVKHIFSIEGIVFVVGTDTNQLGNAICSIYGQGVNCDSYLRKFIDQTFHLPEPDYDSFAKLLHNKLNIQSIIDHMVKIYYPKENMPFFLVFSECAYLFDLSLREQEQCFTKLRAVLVNNLDKEIDLLFLCYLLMAQIKFSEVHEELRRKKFKLPVYYEKIYDLAITSNRQPFINILLPEYLKVLNKSSYEILQSYRTMQPINENQKIIKRFLGVMAKGSVDLKSHVEYAELATNIE